MRLAWARTPFFVVVLVGLFMWMGEIVTRASGGGGRAAALGEGVSVEKGEAVFWDTGKCHTCHAIGTEGSSVRCPDLGQSDAGPPIGVRAAERARERGAELGVEMTLTDYLVETLADPSAYVVEGFVDEMPKVFEPPISLGADDIASVILYLQSRGGSPDPGAIVLPPELRDAGSGGAAVEPWEPYLAGDSLRGRDLFFDVEGPAPCAKCHTVGEEGGDVGPELTSVAGTRTARFIVESILEPSAEIASGYENELLQTTDGRILDGVVRRETADSLWLANAEGALTPLALTSIQRRQAQEVSLMPGNLAEVLSVTDVHDILAYLRTLR